MVPVRSRSVNGLTLNNAAITKVPRSIQAAILNLPGDNLWKLSSVAKALGLSKMSELTRELKALYPTDWRRDLGSCRITP